MKREVLTSSFPKPFFDGSLERKSYEEIVDFFARGPSPAEVVAFQPSEETTERVRYLLDRNAAKELSDEESEELEFLGEVEHFMQLRREPEYTLRRKHEPCPYLRSLTAVQSFSTH